MSTPKIISHIDFPFLCDNYLEVADLQNYNNTC